jgi:lipoprotein-releasing system permease protein
VGRFLAIATGVYLVFSTIQLGMVWQPVAGGWSLTALLALASGSILVVGSALALALGSQPARFLKDLNGVLGIGLLVFLVLFALPPEDQDYLLKAVQMAIVVLTIVLLSSFFTAGAVFFFGICTWLINKFWRKRINMPIYVGWTLLRSHRPTVTIRSQLKNNLMDWLNHGRGMRWRWFALSLVCLIVLLALQDYAWVNSISGHTSPIYTTLIGVVAFASGGAALLFALPSVARFAKPRPREKMMTVANWVTLPTFMSIVGVSVGVWALIVVLSVMNGFATDLRTKILSTNAHLVVESTRPSGGLGDPLNLVDRLKTVAGQAEITPYTHGEVMLSSATNVVVNVVLKGMPEGALKESAQLRGKMVSGAIMWLGKPEALLSDRYRFPIDMQMPPPTPLTPKDKKPSADDTSVEPDIVVTPRNSTWAPVLRPGILLGSELATNLALDVGSEVKVITPDGDVGPTGLRPKLTTFRVAGIFKTGMYEYDQKLAYTTLSAAQRFLNLDRDVNRLEVRFTSQSGFDDSLSALKTMVTTEFQDLKASDWRERNKSLFAALQLERVAMFIVLAFIILVASMLILSSLTMIIVERVRDIAVLKSIGASSSDIVKSFLVIGLFIGVIGVCVGSFLGILTTLVIIPAFKISPGPEYYLDGIPINVDPSEVGFVALAALALCLVATVYPSYIAARLKPVEGLQHG